MDKFIDMLDWSAVDLFAVSREETERLQLQGAKDRFTELIDQIPMLKVLADNQGIGEIRSVNDLVPILFKHTTLKSYPISLLEDGRFDRLTQWLDKLTTHDLSSYDASGVDTIDGWLAWLEKNTPMRLAHSSGTSGKLSFFPRSTDDMPMLVKGIFKAYEGIGDEPKNDLFNSGKDMVFVFAGFRGGNTIPRFMMDGFASMVTGREDSVIALYPSSMSADVLSLQGRVKTAAAAGRLNELKISPGLLARRDELTALFKNRPQQIRDFVDHYRKHYGDRKAIVMGHWTTYLELKTACEEMGFTHLFAPGSVVTGGGGSKGQTLPDGYVETVADFMGIDWLRQFYGMTEINGWARQCPNRQYHIPPYTIPFLLDPDSGEPLPRTGRQTGRFSFLDLLAKTYWDGCISGDELSIEWDKSCGCGRGNPYISAPIQRYSEMQEGDDKISCAGAHNAHEDALNFLAELKAA